MEFCIGTTHRVLLQAINPHKIHVIAIVDEVYVVFKWYGRHKQWWHYQIEHADLLELKIERAKQWDER